VSKKSLKKALAQSNATALEALERVARMESAALEARAVKAARRASPGAAVLAFKSAQQAQEIAERERTRSRAEYVLKTAQSKGLRDAAQAQLDALDGGSAV
jgi:hypothetical protein